MRKKGNPVSNGNGPVLDIGASHFLNSDGAKGEPLPKGVNIRSRNGVQIEFIWNGRRYTETLPGVPTEDAVRKAVRKREAVLEDIAYNRFVYVRIPLMADSDSIPIADSVPCDVGHVAWVS